MGITLLFMSSTMSLRVAALYRGDGRMDTCLLFAASVPVEVVAFNLAPAEEVVEEEPWRSRSKGVCSSSAGWL